VQGQGGRGDTGEGTAAPTAEVLPGPRCVVGLGLGLGLGLGPEPEPEPGVGVQVTCASCRCEGGRCSARDARIVPETLRRSIRMGGIGGACRWGTQAWENPTRPVRSTPCRIGAGFVGQSAPLSWTTAHLTWNPTDAFHSACNLGGRKQLEIAAGETEAGLGGLTGEAEVSAEPGGVVGDKAGDSTPAVAEGAPGVGGTSAEGAGRGVRAGGVHGHRHSLSFAASRCKNAHKVRRSHT